MQGDLNESIISRVSLKDVPELNSKLVSSAKKKEKNAILKKWQ